MGKICTTCQILKDESEFYNRSAKESATRHQKLQSTCKICMKKSKTIFRSNPEKRKRELELQKINRQNHPEREKYFGRKSSLAKLGISIEEYDKQLQTQNGLCAICKKPESAVLHGRIKRLAVDHCHKNGSIRGLLCTRCNTALGLLQENTDFISNLLSYLLASNQR